MESLFDFLLAYVASESRVHGGLQFIDARKARFRQILAAFTQGPLNCVSARPWPVIRPPPPPPPGSVFLHTSIATIDISARCTGSEVLVNHVVCTQKHTDEEVTALMMRTRKTNSIA